MSSYYETLTPKQKARFEASKRRIFAKEGFDPDEIWAWLLRLYTGKPVMLREFQQKVLGEARRRGWLLEANLDYEPEPVHEEADIPLPNDWWEIKAWPNFGASEGIYMDWVLEGHYCGEALPRLPADAFGLKVERTDRADPAKGWNVRYRLHSGKTLDEDLAGMERMSLLTGRILWLCREFPY